MRKLSPPIDLIKKGVSIFTKRENFVFLILIYSPAAFFSAVSMAQSYLPDFVRNPNSNWLIAAAGILQIIYLLTGVFIAASGIVALGKVVDGAELSVRKTFKTAWKNYWIFLLLSIVLFLLYVLGFVLLIVPGLLFVVWFAFSKFIAIEKGSGVKESLLRSKELVKGIFWKVLGRLVVFGAFTFIIEIILMVIPFGIGSVMASLCGGLFMLPLFLLFRELSV